MTKTLITLTAAIALMGTTAANAATKTGSGRTVQPAAKTYRIDAGSTGQGTATDDDCRAGAQQINAMRLRAANIRRQGDESGARLEEAIAMDYLIWLEDDGCYIVY